MTTPFDLTAAKKRAADKATEAIVLSAGDASNRFDQLLSRLADNADMDDAAKAQALSLIADNVSSMVSMILSGKRPRALASSPASRSGDEDGDLVDKLEKADARNKQLEANQRVLIETINKATGMPVDLVDGDVPASTLRDAQKAVADKVAQAKAEATPRDVVDKAKLQAHVDNLHANLEALKKPGVHLWWNDAKLRKQLVSSAEEVVTAVGPTTR